MGYDVLVLFSFFFFTKYSGKKGRRLVPFFFFNARELLSFETILIWVI